MTDVSIEEQVAALEAKLLNDKWTPFDGGNLPFDDSRNFKGSYYTGSWNLYRLNSHEQIECRKCTDHRTPTGREYFAEKLAFYVSPVRRSLTGETVGWMAGLASMTYEEAGDRNTAIEQAIEQAARQNWEAEHDNRD